MGREIHADAESRTALADEAEPVELDLLLSPQTDAALDRLARDIGGTKVDVFKHALALLSLAVDAMKQGKRVAIVDEAGKVETEITEL